MSGIGEGAALAEEHGMRNVWVQAGALSSAAEAGALRCTTRSRAPCRCWLQARSLPRP